MPASKIVNARHLALYPKDCLCQVETSLGKEDYALVALYLNGARLMRPQPVRDGVLVPGIAARLDIILTMRGAQSGPFPCRVSDIHDREAFLVFGRPLRFSFLGTMRDNPRHFA